MTPPKAGVASETMRLTVNGPFWCVVPVLAHILLAKSVGSSPGQPGCWAQAWVPSLLRDWADWDRYRLGHRWVVLAGFVGHLGYLGCLTPFRTLITNRRPILSSGMA